MNENICQNCELQSYCQGLKNKFGDDWLYAYYCKKHQYDKFKPTQKYIDERIQQAMVWAFLQMTELSLQLLENNVDFKNDFNLIRYTEEGNFYE